MSTTMMIWSGIVAWALVATLTALVVGRIVQRRDGHRPLDADPIPAKAPVPGRATGGGTPTSAPEEDPEQPSLRRGRR